MSNASKSTRQGQRNSEQGIRWKVVVDPDGIFRGRLFTLEQIKHGGFDNGTIFENTVTGQRLRWICGSNVNSGVLKDVADDGSK